MRFIVFFGCFLIFLGANAQIGTGQWRLHVSPTRTLDVATGNGLVMAAFPSGLVEYDIEAGESTLWTDVNFLSDVNLSALHFDPISNAFWVGYANGNIDKIKDNAVINLPALKLASVLGDRNINNFLGYNDFMYVSTGLGILKINPSKNEVTDTYYPNASQSPILEIAILNDTIYALTENKVYKGAVNNIALADPVQWIVDSRIPDPGATASYKSLVAFDNDLFITYNKDIYGQDSVFRVNTANLEMVVGDIFDLEITGLKVINNNLYVILDGGILYYDNTFASVNSINTYAFSTRFRSNGVALAGGVHYIADELNGLVYYKNTIDNRPLNVSGPPKNSFFTLGGAKDKIAVAGGTLLQSGFEYNPSGAYVLQDENWALFDMFNQPAWQGKAIWDVNSVSINPKNTDEIAIGAYCGDALSIATDGKQVDQVYSANNSILEVSSLGNNATCVTDVEYDEDGNLWIANGLSNKPLKVKTAEGLWYAFDLGASAKSRLSGKLVIDYNQNKWMNILNAGLFGYNDGGTISDPSDDQYKLINSGVNSGDLPSDNITAIAVDFDNEIWIGTDNGFAILYNSENIFEALPGGYNTQRIKLDFEGNVEYMLGSTYITDIEIDGGNRKWIGTANTGIFLLSPDGLEILAHYTTENSPLISNNIMDMQINQMIGEMFIATDKGLLSYRIDASYEDPEYSDVQVFPNPVNPSFFGPVTIQGIKYNSDVKVTDIAGNLVYKTTSNGGTATWNCKNLNGERVKTGVYLIWTTPNEGKGRKVGKVTIIN